MSKFQFSMSQIESQFQNVYISKLNVKYQNVKNANVKHKFLVYQDQGLVFSAILKGRQLDIT